MVTVDEAQASVNQARQLVEQKRAEAQAVQDKLQQQAQSLPEATQKNLRQGLFQGIQGRNRLQQVQTARSQIEGQQGVVRNYLGDLTNYEQNQINPVQSQINEIQHNQDAYSNALKLYAAKVPYNQVSDPATSNYLKQLYYDYNVAQQNFTDQVNNLQSQLPPDDKLIVDYKNLRVTGVNSGTLGKTLTVQGYNDAITKLNNQMNSTPDINTQGLDRTTMTNLNQKSNNSIFSQPLFPLVSAQSVNPTYQAPITGNVVANQSNNQSFFGALLRGTVQKPPQEIYTNVSGVNAFVTNPNQAGTTAIFRQPTLIEQQKLNQRNDLFGQIGNIETNLNNAIFPLPTQTPLSDFKRSIGVGQLPPVKNLPTESQIQNASFGQLYQSGNYPAIVRKAFYSGAEGMITGGEQYTKATGLGTLNPETKQTASRVLGQGLLFGAFSPVMSTGTYATQELDNTELIYDYIKGKWVRKNLITGEITDATTINSLIKIEKNVASKPNYEAQMEYLNSIKSQLKTPEQLKNFDTFVQGLIDKNVVKLPTYKLLGNENYAPQKTTIDISGLPTMKNTGTTGATITNIKPTTQPPKVGNIFLTPSNNKQTNSNLPNLIGKIKNLSNQRNNALTGMGSILGLNQFSNQVPRQSSGQKTIQTTKTIQGSGSDFSQITGLKTNQSTRQTTRERETTKKPKPMEKMNMFFSSPVKSKKVNDILGDLKDIFVRKQGKDVYMGSAKTDKEAFNILFGDLNKSLSASGFVQSRATGQRIMPFDLGNMFRPSKREAGRIVEKRQFRLNTPSEVSDILGFRKTKGKSKKKKKLSWW